MDGGFKPVVALIAGLALACVLISPMPDEFLVPPSNSVSFHAGFLLFRDLIAGVCSSRWWQHCPRRDYTPPWILAVTCARLC